MEVAAFRDEGANLPKDAAVWGVSKDRVADQKAFATKMKMAFPLLADAKGEVIETYGVAGMLGMAKRWSFLIDSKGTIAKIYEKVSPARHAKEVLEDLKSVT